MNEFENNINLSMYVAVVLKMSDDFVIHLDNVRDINERDVEKMNLYKTIRQKSFQDLIKLLLQSPHYGENDLASLFEVSPSTIVRWSEGKSIPHRCVQEYVANFVIMRYGEYKWA